MLTIFNVFDIIFYIFLFHVSLNYLLRIWMISLFLSFNPPTSSVEGKWILLRGRYHFSWGHLCFISPSIDPRKVPHLSSFHQDTCSLRGTSLSLLICIPWAQLLKEALLVTASVYLPRFSLLSNPSNDFKEMRVALSFTIQHILRRQQK